MDESSIDLPNSSRKKQLKFKPRVPSSKPAKRTRGQMVEPYGTKPVIDKDIMNRLKSREWTIKTRSSLNDGGNSKPQSSKDAVVKSRKKKKEPYISLPLRPDSTELLDLEVLNVKEFGKPPSSSSELESSIDPTEELGLLKESERERMLFFKLPKSFPLEKQATINIEREKKGPICKKKCGNLQDLPPGRVGKILVYKSGKAKMKLGDNMSNVDPGIKCIFFQQAVTVNTRQKKICELGKIDEQSVVVTPDVGSLLDDMAK